MGSANDFREKIKYPLRTEFEKIPIFFTWKAEFDVIAAVNVLNQFVDLSTVAYSKRQIFILNLNFHFCY